MQVTGGSPAHVVNMTSAMPVSIPVPQQVDVVDGYHKKTGKAMGYIQLTCGILSVIMEIFNLTLCPFPVGAGIWSGVVFIASGIVGINASIHRSRCLIIAYMIMSIISAVVAAIGLTMASINSANPSCRGGVGTALPAMIALVAFVDFFFAIIASAWCCKATCCMARPSQTIIYYSVGAGGSVPISSAANSVPTVILVPTSGPASVAPAHGFGGLPAYSPYQLPSANTQPACAAAAVGGIPPPFYDDGPSVEVKLAPP